MSTEPDYRPLTDEDRGASLTAFAYFICILAVLLLALLLAWIIAPDACKPSCDFYKPEEVDRQKGMPQLIQYGFFHQVLLYSHLWAIGYGVIALYCLSRGFVFSAHTYTHKERYKTIHYYREESALTEAFPVVLVIVMVAGVILFFLVVDTMFTGLSNTATALWYWPIPTITAFGALLTAGALPHVIVGLPLLGLWPAIYRLAVKWMRSVDGPR